MVLRAKRVAGLALLLTSLMFSSAAIGAQQAPAGWNQWRGPARDGVGDARTLPATLPEQLTEVWRVPVGEGYSGPLVVDGRVYQFSRDNGREVLRALSLAEGSEIWSESYEAPFTVESAARSHGSGPKSTPVYADGRVFTLGISGVLSALNATDGSVLWRHEFAEDFPKTWPLWGASMSPIVIGDRVFAHVGGDAGGAMTAFDVASGEVVWANDEFTPGYASPIHLQIEGADVLVTQSNEHIIAVNAADGTTLWSMPFATSSWQNAVTPLAVGGEVVFSGLDLGIFSVRLAPGAGAWAATSEFRGDEGLAGDLVRVLSGPPIRRGTDRGVGPARNRGD